MRIQAEAYPSMDSRRLPSSCSSVAYLISLLGSASLPPRRDRRVKSSRIFYWILIRRASTEQSTSRRHPGLAVRRAHTPSCYCTVRCRPSAVIAAGWLAQLLGMSELCKSRLSTRVNVASSATRASVRRSYRHRRQLSETRPLCTR